MESLLHMAHLESTSGHLQLLYMNTTAIRHQSVHVLAQMLHSVDAYHHSLAKTISVTLGVEIGGNSVDSILEIHSGMDKDVVI